MLKNIAIPKHLNPDPKKDYLTYPFRSESGLLLVHVPTDRSFPIFDPRNDLDLPLNEFFEIKKIERSILWNTTPQ